MKKLINLIVTVLFFQLGLNLQAQQIHYGLGAAYVITNAHVIKSNDYAKGIFSPMHSYSIHGFIEFRFAGAWGMAAEPGLIRKGGGVDGKNHYLGDFDLQLHYFHLPLLAHLYYSDKLYVSFGPEFSFLLSNDGNVPDLPATFTPSEKAAYQMFTPFEEHAFEISAMIGLNYKLIKHIDIGLRYSHALTKFSETSWINPRYPIGYGIMGYANVYNQYLQLIVRYII